MEILAGEIGSWFGFVGACVISPAPACQPFLAFIALMISAAVCLLLTIVALRAIWRNERRNRKSLVRQDPVPAASERVEPVFSPAQRESASRSDDRWGVTA
jgi:hypothetical protein